jgi:hypothetical protein
MRRFLVYTLFVLVLTGCDAFGGDDGPPVLDGPYEITTQNEGADLTLDLDLSETDNDLSGTGLLIAEDPNSSQAITSDLDISGTHNHPDVQIEMVVEETDATVSFDGNASDNGERANGTLTFADGTQQEVVLRSE